MASLSIEDEHAGESFNSGLITKSLTLERLSFHLLNEQTIIFPEAGNIESIVQNSGIEKTMFTE
ncbi:unnamed protein product [Dovyalis caffra]|uniref:Uncharacterized protein n=1 Tax=Dovyalis caffra TaxID=77055 RepID=A0AAV1SQC2_9ROSI|nr:unnamed protein product [Dovyalis caffra]CAK7354650.1 unnamed protein product [Dovyalis caffra]